MRTKLVYSIRKRSGLTAAVLQGGLALICPSSWGGNLLPAERLIAQVAPEGESRIQRAQEILELQRSADEKYFSSDPPSAIQELTALAEITAREMTISGDAAVSKPALSYNLFLYYGRLGAIYKLRGEQQRAESNLRLARLYASIAMANPNLTLDEAENLIKQLDSQRRQRMGK